MEGGAGGQAERERVCVNLPQRLALSHILRLAKVVCAESRKAEKEAETEAKAAALQAKANHKSDRTSSPKKEAKRQRRQSCLRLCLCCCCCLGAAHKNLFKIQNGKA